ncbi:hypothetical protein Tco_1368798 [Tanacetum coccineum]
MIRRKVMRTLASVEIKIMLILGLPCCLSSSSVQCLENVVHVPLLKDPYEAIRHAYLDGTNTESEHFEDPIETKTPESLPDSTPPTCHVEESEGSDTSGARSTSSDSTTPLSPDHPLTHTTPTLVAAMSESVFRKRFRSSYKSLPSSSPPDLPSRKRYQGTSELVEDDDEEDDEIEESLDSDIVSEDTEDEGPIIEDEDPAAGDKGLAAGDECPGMGVESHGLDDEGHSVESDGLGLGEEEEVVPERRGSGSTPRPERPERVLASRQPTLTTWTDPEDGIVYIDVPAYPPPAPPIQTPPSPKCLSGSLPISPSPSIVPLPISSPMIPLTVPSPIASHATAETEGFLTKLRAQVEMQGGLICDHVV